MMVHDMKFRFFFCKQKTAYEMRIREWSSDVCSSDLWDRIHDRTPAGAARNAVDCAVWDLRAKRSGRSVAALMGQPEPVPVPTTYTLGLDSPVAMAAAAKVAGAAHGHLKIKLGAGGDDIARLRAIRDAVPDARLIADRTEEHTHELQSLK